jgi:hypothetical protein
MTEEAVRVEFGEPEVINGSGWYYTNEKQNWGGTAYCALFAPGCAFMSLFTLPFEGKTFFHLFGIEESPFVLYWDANKLDRWEFGSYRHPNPAEKDSAAIGIVVELRASFNFLWLFTHEPTAVYFERVERGIRLSGDRRVSNFVQGNRAYLLNAPPGEYVAVEAVYVIITGGGSQQSTSTHHTVIFSDEMIKATRTVAAPGEMVFMGAWLVRNDRKGDGFWSRLKDSGCTGHASHPEKKDRSDTARVSFFEAAREDFGKTPWAGWLGASEKP